MSAKLKQSQQRETNQTATDDPHAQVLALSYHLAEVMENPFISSRLYNAIGDELNEIQNDHQESAGVERKLRAGLFVPSLLASYKNDEDDAKPENQVGSPPRPFQSLADRLQDLIDDSNMPSKAAELLEAAATEFINQNDVQDAGFVRRTFGEACFNARRA